MRDTTTAPMYATLSKENSARQPGRRLLSSVEVGWQALLFETWEQPGSVPEFSTVGTPDQLIVLTSRGQYNLESLHSGNWRSARYSPGNGGATAPLGVSTLRWHSDVMSITTQHLYLPQCFLLEAGEEYRRAGTGFRANPIDYLSMDDPHVYSTILSLARAIEQGAPDLYCTAAAHMLATHLLLSNKSVRPDQVTREIGGGLTDGRLARILEYMRHNSSQQLSLDQLAREAALSRFHFVRLFKMKVGMAPHSFLVKLRLEHAALLLRTTDLDIAAVSRASGYLHGGRFARAFRELFLLSPSAYRTAAMSRNAPRRDRSR